MFEATLIALALFPVGVIYASAAEWAIHKRLMHQPIIGVQHFYYGHAKVHHGLYQANDSYVLGDRPSREITLAWWAMPLPVLLQFPLLVPLALFVSLPGAIGFTAALIVYQTLYETLHYVMHAPTDRWVERTVWFKWLNEHHFQHHRKHSTNLNIVLPIFDYLFSTRVRPKSRVLAEA